MSKAELREMRVRLLRGGALTEEEALDLLERVEELIEESPCPFCGGVCEG